YETTWELGRKNHADYCARHSYRYVHRSDGFDHSRPPSWSKLRFIRDALEETDWVFWIDSDAVFMDWSCRLEWFLEDGFDLVLARDQLNGLNAGVFFTRNSAWSRAFLDRVDGMRQFTGHPFWETAAVMRLEADDAEVRSRCWVVPQRLFNSYPHFELAGPELDAYGPGDFVAHFAGLPGREAAVRDFAVRAEASNKRDA